MTALYIKLILAHFTGDFLLQPSTWVKHKEAFKLKSKYLYLHVIIHGLALLVVLQFQFKYVWGIVFITLSHLIIDVVKSYLTPYINTRLLFATDQLVHLLCIALTVYMYSPSSFDLHIFFDDKLLLFLCCLLFVTVVSSVIMKIVISKWQLEENNETSLKDAGAYIGILERIFVFVFISINYWEGIGFLITAKSVFRFGDLSKAKDRKLTEYILIGTLISFGLAIGCGLAFNYVLPKL